MESEIKDVPLEIVTEQLENLEGSNVEIIDSIAVMDFENVWEIDGATIKVSNEIIEIDQK